MLFICYSEQYVYQWYHLFIKAIVQCLEEKNISYEFAYNVSDAFSKVKQDDIIFLISGVTNFRGKNTRNALGCLRNKNIKILVYNTEDIINSQRCKDMIAGYLNNKAFCVMDFSKKRLDSLIYTPHKIQLCPGYHPLFEKNDKKTIKEKKYDIICYGTMNDRRINLKNKLKEAGLNVIFKNYINEQRQYDDIMQSKIVLDTYYHGVTGIDFFRCNFLAANKIFFIHETPVEEDTDNDFLNTVVHANYEEIPQRCVEWLSKSQEEREAKALEVYNLFKTKYNIKDQLPYEFFK